MRLDSRLLRRQGFNVEYLDRGKGEFVVEIFPQDPADIHDLIQMLQEKYGLTPMYAHGLVEDLHTYQVFSAISRQ